MDSIAPLIAWLLVLVTLGVAAVFARQQVRTLRGLPSRTRLAADLKKRYNAGESIRSLAGATGRSYGFVHRILTETGVSLRGRGGATRGKGKR